MYAFAQQLFSKYTGYMFCYVNCMSFVGMHLIWAAYSISTDMCILHYVHVLQLVTYMCMPSCFSCLHYYAVAAGSPSPTIALCLFHLCSFHHFDFFFKVMHLLFLFHHFELVLHLLLL